MFKKDQITEVQKTTERNQVAKNTTITGSITSDGDFRIDGVLDGDLTTKGRVVIGTEGLIKGTVNCVNADIEGKFEGELKVANLLTIKATAIITGNVIVGKLSVEPGASFNASCAMKNAVKELNQAKKNEQKKATEKTA